MSEQNTANTSEEVQATAETGLNLSDIENAVKVIDYAQAQGAFKDWETIEKVLFVRKRLAAFVDAASAVAAAQKGEANSSENTAQS